MVPKPRVVDHPDPSPRRQVDHNLVERDAAKEAVEQGCHDEDDRKRRSAHQYTSYDVHLPARHGQGTI